MKKRICIINSFPIYPPVAGGQIRVYNIAKNLSANFEVSVVTISPGIGMIQKFKIGKLEIINIPTMSLIPGALCSRLSGLPIGEVFLSYSSKFAFRFQRVLKKHVKSSDYIFLERPYLSHLIKKYVNESQMIIYSAHDVEIILKQKIFETTPFSRKLISIVKNVEKMACDECDVILIPSANDKKKLQDIYNLSSLKIHVIPNGVDCSKISLPSLAEKNKAKKNLGLENETLILFMGSAHPPNIVAAQFIISKIAHKICKSKFLIIGSVKRGIINNNDNVILTGIVDDETKIEMLKASDIALNPIQYGSGTNIKLLEYFAAGLPVITTSEGARGIEIRNNQTAIISEIEDFNNLINYLLSNNEVIDQISKNARHLVEEKYEWGVISKKIVELIAGKNKD